MPVIKSKVIRVKDPETGIWHDLPATVSEESMRAAERAETAAERAEAAAEYNSHLPVTEAMEAAQRAAESAEIAQAAASEALETAENAVDIAEGAEETANHAAETATEAAVAATPAIVTGWLDENITPADPPVVIDTSLSVTGAAADAKAAGVAVTKLNNAIIGSEIPAEGLSWEQGGLSSSNGGPSETGSETPATNRIRTSYKKIVGFSRFNCPLGYKMMLFLYTSSSYQTYLGVWNGTGYAQTAYWMTGDVWTGGIDRAYYFRLVLAKTDDADLLPEDGRNLTSYRRTDTSLSQTDIPADAETVGNKFSDMEDFNTKLVRSKFTYLNVTANAGIEATISNSVVTITMASGYTETVKNCTVAFAGNTTTVPDWLESDTEYFAELSYGPVAGETEYAGYARLEIIRYTTDNGITTAKTLYSGTASGSFNTGDLTGGNKGVVFRYFIPAGETGVSMTARTRIFTQPTHEALQKLAKSGVGRTVRLMQWNIGDYVWGANPGQKPDGGSGRWRELTEEEYAVLLPNYKRFFGDYRPDILCLQEFNQEFYVSGREENPKALEVLFTPLFAKRSISSSSASTAAIMACENVGAFYWIDKVVLPDLAGSRHHMKWRATTLPVNSGLIGIATGALAATTSTVTVPQAAREAELATLCHHMIDVGYQGAVLAGDFNGTLTDYAYPGTPQEVLDEFPELAGVTDECTNNYDALMAIAAHYGFTPANGEFWGEQPTYVDQPAEDPPVANPNKPLDNVLVRGQVKIRNFEVLGDYYTDLSSDHIPVIADLYIW